MPVHGEDPKLGKIEVGKPGIGKVSAVDGVDYVTTLEISLGTSGSEYSSVISIDYDEYSETKIGFITVSAED